MVTANKIKGLEMPYCTTNDGVKLYYEEAGEGTPILFVHEFAGDYRSWEPQVNYFSRYNRCITYNARGYYPSDVPKEEISYSQERAWKDIICIMDKLDIEKAHIVGLSMGGFATLHFGINEPHRAKSLVIAGCGYGAIPIDKATYDKKANFSSVALETAKNIIQKGMNKVGAEYALGPSRVQFQNKDPKGWQLFNDFLINHDSIGSANTLLGVQNKRPNLYELEKEISNIKTPLSIASLITSKLI